MRSLTAAVSILLALIGVSRADVAPFAADYRPALTKVDRPTLIVAMRNEWAAQFEALQRSVPRSKLVLVDGVAHGMFLEYPERFNPIVEEFLGSLSAAPP